MAAASRRVVDRPVTDSRPVDLVFLAKQTMGDTALEREILSLFEQVARRCLSRARDTRGPEQRLELHALKGAALGVGATAVAEQAREAEAECLADGVTRRESIADLAIAIEEVGTFIAGLLAEEQ